MSFAPPSKKQIPRPSKSGSAKSSESKKSAAASPALAAAAIASDTRAGEANGSLKQQQHQEADATRSSSIASSSAAAAGASPAASSASPAVPPLQIIPEGGDPIVLNDDGLLSGGAGDNGRLESGSHRPVSSKGQLPAAPTTPRSFPLRPAHKMLPPDLRKARTIAEMYDLIGANSAAYARAKSTPFVKYLYRKAFVVEISRLDNDSLDLVLTFLKRLPVLHTIRLTDAANLESNKRKEAAQRKSLARKKRAKPGGAGGDGPPKRSKSAQFQPSGHALQAELGKALPMAVSKHAGRLEHLELIGVHQNNWKPFFDAIAHCTKLRRLYLRECNLGDGVLDLLVAALQHCPSIQHLAVDGCGITAKGAHAIRRLIRAQSIRRDMANWENTLRGGSGSGSDDEDSKAMSDDDLCQLHNGLLSLDLSRNQLGTAGILAIAEILADDELLLALDIRNNNFSDDAISAIVENVLKNNTFIIKIKVMDRQPGPNGLTFPSRTEELMKRLDPHFEIRARRRAALKCRDPSFMLMPQLDLMTEDTRMMSSLAHLRRDRPGSPMAAKSAARDARRSGGGGGGGGSDSKISNNKRTRRQKPESQRQQLKAKAKSEARARAERMQLFLSSEKQGFTVRLKEAGDLTDFKTPYISMMEARIEKAKLERSRRINKNKQMARRRGDAVNLSEGAAAAAAAGDSSQPEYIDLPGHGVEEDMAPSVAGLQALVAQVAERFEDLEANQAAREEQARLLKHQHEEEERKRLEDEQGAEKAREQAASTSQANSSGSSRSKARNRRAKSSGKRRIKSLLSENNRLQNDLRQLQENMSSKAQQGRESDHDNEESKNTDNIDGAGGGASMSKSQVAPESSRSDEQQKLRRRRRNNSPRKKVPAKVDSGLSNAQRKKLASSSSQRRPVKNRSSATAEDKQGDDPIVAVQQLDDVLSHLEPAELENRDADEIQLIMQHLNHSFGRLHKFMDSLEERQRALENAPREAAVDGSDPNAARTIDAVPEEEEQQEEQVNDDFRLRVANRLQSIWDDHSMLVE